MFISKTVTQKPTRIVCLVPSITEYLHTLGLDVEVVGITKFCIHPSEWFRTKKRIGGTKNVHINAIDALQPDLIIANKEENVKEQINELADKYPVYLTNVKNLKQAYDMMLNLGKITHTETKAVEIIKEIKTAFTAVKKLRKSINVSYLIWQKPYIAVSNDTFIGDLLRICGLNNMQANHKDRYPNLSEDELKQAQVVLLSTEPYPFKERHLKQIITELNNHNVFLIDGEMFSWYGSRLLLAAKYLQEVIRFFVVTDLKATNQINP
jgi:ABC-type Fe3+-hydroxamate transport system substrate-binding protein